MLSIPVKEGESIERSLKKYKRKFERTKVLRELRARKKYTKPTEIRREEKKKAIYVQGMKQAEQA